MSGDTLFKGLLAAIATSIVLLLVAMALSMLQASGEALHHFGFGFLISSAWNPVEALFGSLPFLFGTVATSLLALLVAVPIALGIAVQLSELTPRKLRGLLSFFVDLLAAIPSVVYGLWGVFVLAPLLRDHLQPALATLLGRTPFFSGIPRGFGFMAAGLILALMILPTIASVARDVMRALPRTYREGAIALGATRWETIRIAVLGPARVGILGAIVLGLGRALGETMAVTMLIGNRPEISASLFSPGATLASTIANEYAEAVGDLHLSSLTALGLVLFFVALASNIGGRFLTGRLGSRMAHS